MKLRIITVGSSVGVVLPKELLSKLGVDKGDFLYLVDSADGMTVMPYDPDFEEDMEHAEETIKQYKDAFKKLAK